MISRNSSQKTAVSYCIQSLAEFAAKAANKVEMVFGRGVYVDENTASTNTNSSRKAAVFLWI